MYRRRGRRGTPRLRPFAERRNIRMKNRDRKSSTVFIFTGALLLVIAGVGIATSRDPGALLPKYRYDYTLEVFVRFCAEWWIPAGIIGVPMFLISLVLSLYRESKENKG